MLFFRELRRKRPFGADNLALKLRFVQAQRRDLTPLINSKKKFKKARILKAQARKELENDGCPPCYSFDLDFPLRNSPEKY